ncbi:DUF1800 domain-containing protein [Methylomagnum sp.]
MRSITTLLVRLLGLLAFLAMDAALAAISISPITDSVPLDGTRTYTAAVSGLPNTTVTWSVNGIQGGNLMTVGSVDATGKYTAPSAMPPVNPVAVTATASDANSASAIVTLRLPRPLISSATPTPVTPTSFNVVVKGSRFYPQVWATLNGQPVTLQYQSTGQVTLTVLSPPQGQTNLVLSNAANADSAAFKLCLTGCYSSVTPTPPYEPAAPADPVDVAAARFLEQASFGPDAASLLQMKQLIGSTGNATAAAHAWIDAQLALPETTYPDGTMTIQMGGAWLKNMASAPDQLRQRTMFALSQIFVVSTNKNTTDSELLPWVRLLSRNALRAPTNEPAPYNSPFFKLMKEVTLSPTMGKYLDLANSRRPGGNGQSAANENYARELMQLFTLGLVQLDEYGNPITDANNKPLPTYDQTTIQRLALALTGWTYPTQPGQAVGVAHSQYFVGEMEPLDQYHDQQEKTLFPGAPGETKIKAGLGASAELDEALKAIFNHPNLPPFIATRFIRGLVTSNPDGNYIKYVAAAFANNGQGVRGDLRAVVRATLTYPDARQDSPTANQGHLKDPVTHLVGFMRAMGANLTDPSPFQWELFLMGQKVLEPPSVFGHYSPLYRLTSPDGAGLFGPEYQIYTPARAVHRANGLWGILNAQSTNTSIQINLSPFASVADNPNVLLDKVNATLFQGRMSPALRKTLYDTALPYTDLTTRAKTVLYLAVISSEYLIHR